jgi:arylsulfatase
VRREVSSIDIGTAAGRSHLTFGWSVDEQWPGGTTGAWSDGDRSEVEFYLAEPRALRLVLRGEPYGVGEGRTQVVAVGLNGRSLGRVSPAPRPHRFEVAVPEGATRAGTNRLELRYAITASPADGSPTSADNRRLAVFWRSVDLRGANDSPPPRRKEDTETLVLPPGTCLDYYLDIPANAVLALAAVTGTSRRGAVEIRLWPEGAPSRVVDTLRPGRGGRIVPLGNALPGIVRLSFRYTGPSSPAGAEAALRLVRPRLVARASPLPSPTRASPGARPPHVFIYLVDALRADRLGCYGYDRGTSPRLDAFARDAVLVTRTFAHSSWTKASVASLFTGMTPFRHGTNDRGDALAPELPTLAGALRAAGYHTIMVYANAWVGPPWGLDRGFEDARKLHLARSDRIHDEIVSVLDAAARDPRPLFLYVHTIDPHDPYDPPEAQWRRFAAPKTPMRRASHDDLRRIVAEVQADPARRARRAEELSALYDAEVAANDEQFGRFVEELRRRGLLETSLIVFTADHGEEFLEHGGLKHGRSLFPEVLHVPLVLRFPGGVNGPGRIPWARHVDVFPTILAVAGLPVPGSVEGRTIAPKDSHTAGASMARLRLDDQRLSSWTDTRWHAIWTESDSSPAPRGMAVYDLRTQAEVSEQHPVASAFARRELQFALSRGPERALPEGVPSRETLESLKALGYVQ